MKRLYAGFLPAACFVAIVSIPLASFAQAPDWPMLSRNQRHNAYTAASGLTASTASKLGLNWMANLHAADLGSPVVAYNTVLNKTVIYVGDENGDVFAYDESNGEQIWGVNVSFGDPERATPGVAPDGSVWVSTAYDATVTKLDGATGQTLCSQQLNTTIDASIMFGTPPGGDLTVYTGTNDGNTRAGEEVAISESDCSLLFVFTDWRTYAGTWTTTAFSLNAAGSRALAIFGSSDPDSTEYAIDAATGALIWEWRAENPAPYAYDVGEAADISPPGVNGFADGVAYVSSKYGVMNALDLMTGVPIWQFDMYPAGYTGLRDARSGPAFDGNTIVFGYLGGVWALNAVTGAARWQYASPTGLEVISSPAIAGPKGQEIVAFSDVAGQLHVLQMSNGQQLYSYQTGGYVTASVAVANGHLVTVSTDGFLYDFMVDGGNSADPSTQLSYPLQGADVNNPNGNLTATGSASDAQGVSAVEVAVASLGPTGVQWYDAASGAWNNAAIDNPATLSPPAATSTQWSFSFPAPPSGGTFEVFANAVNVEHQADVVGAHSTFSILPSPSAPQIQLSNQYVSPGGTFTVTGSGFGSSESVTFSVDGDVRATAMTNASGAVPSTPITLPGSGTYGPTSRFGPTSLVAVGQTSGRTTSAFLDITNNWSQGGEGPTRIAFEAYDEVLHDLLHVAQNQFVEQAWYTQTGSPIQSSPAVMDGIAYVGNNAGVLSAIRVSNGAPAWTYSTPSGAPIHSAPAVDGSLVLFGSNDGTLYEVSTTTGTLFGSLAIGGKLTSPAAINGTAYISSENGAVVAVLESNKGSPLLMWTVSLGAPIHSSVAFDSQSSGKPVIVGDDSGTITALNGTTGATLWTAQTGGSVTASPSISGGRVYVGSTDGYVYAFNESTGALVWKFNAGSAIHAGGVVGGVVGSNTSVVYGTTSGRLIALTAAGKLEWSSALGESIVGVAAAFDAVISEGANGTIFGNRGTQGGLKIWQFQTGEGLSTAPAINDGDVYVGAQDTGLYKFSPYGK